jgi:hypothetical protein
MRTLCSLKRCNIDIVSKSQMMISAWNPIWVFWPDAMYLPVFDTVITEMSLSCPLRNYCVLVRACLTTIVVPKGKIICSLSGCKISPLLTLP